MQSCNLMIIPTIERYCLVDVVVIVLVQTIMIGLHVMITRNLHAGVTMYRSAKQTSCLDSPHPYKFSAHAG